jgi:hypothetical protein
MNSIMHGAIINSYNPPVLPSPPFPFPFPSHSPPLFLLLLWIPPSCPSSSLCPLQRQNTEISKHIFPEKEYRGPQFQFPHSCVCERCLYFHDRSPCSAEGNMWTDHGTIYFAHRHMNVEIGAEAALIPEKEYIKGIFVAVPSPILLPLPPVYSSLTFPFSPSFFLPAPLPSALL